jgi:uncharacterized protein (TIGR03792 family)
MVIEWLKVNVPPEKRELYIQKDDEIWSAALAKHPGYVGKEVWLNPKKESELVLVIYWESKEAWDAIPTSVLEETERRFTEAMGSSFPIVEGGEYKLLKAAGIQFIQTMVFALFTEGMTQIMSIGQSQVF